MKDFSNYKFRASQSSKLKVGTIGITEIQEAELVSLAKEKETGINVNGNKIKWTPTKEERLKKLIKDKELNALPKTIITELRKIHREETTGRRFIVTNKYIQKGLVQEEEGFSVYQQWLQEIKGQKTFLQNNKTRLENEFFTGETDSSEWFHKTFDHGFDIKISWDLKTFPYDGDDLADEYFCQNQVYMDISQKSKIKLKKWKTVFVLVNCTEFHLYSEKQKHFYAMGSPREDSKQYGQYLEICRELEKMMIFDYDRFVQVNPYHNLEYSKKEWEKEKLDIPLIDRVLEFEVYYDEKYMEDLKERVVLSREYLNSLSKKRP